MYKEPINKMFCFGTTILTLGAISAFTQPKLRDVNIFLLSTGGACITTAALDNKCLPYHPTFTSVGFLHNFLGLPPRAALYFPRDSLMAIPPDIIALSFCLIVSGEHPMMFASS